MLVHHIDQPVAEAPEKKERGHEEERERVVLSVSGPEKAGFTHEECWLTHLIVFECTDNCADRLADEFNLPL